MNKNKYALISGLIAFIAGIALIICGVYGSYRMAEARQNIDSKTSFIPNNFFKRKFIEKLNKRVDKYCVPVARLYIGGAVLILASGVLIYYGRRSASH